MKTGTANNTNYEFDWLNQMGIRKNIIELHVRHALQNEEKGNIFVLKRNNCGLPQSKL